MKLHCRRPNKSQKTVTELCSSSTLPYMPKTARTAPLFTEEPLTPHPQSLFSGKGLLASVTILFVAFLAALIGFLTNKPMPADQPLQERSNVATSCQGRVGESLQNCCEDELNARAGLKASCVGAWEISDNRCNWTCTSTP
jgi:hypothetical protein